MSAQDNLQTLRDAQSPFSVFAAINNPARIGLSDLNKEVRVVTATTLGTVSINPTLTAPSGIVVLANLTALTGALTIAPPTYELYLPKLTALAQNLTVTANTVLTTCKVPLLASIAASKTLSVNNSSALATVDFGSLTTLDGGMYLTNSPALQAAAFPALQTIGAAGVLYLSGLTNAALTSLSFPLLTSGGTLSAQLLHKVTSISLPRLATAKTLSLGSNAALTSVNLPSLTAVTGNLESINNTAMATFSAPELTSVEGNLQLEGCSALTSVSCPKLVTAPYVSIGWNPSLTALSLPKLNPINHLNLSGCTQLTSLSLPEATSVTGSINLGGSGLTSLALPGITTFSGGASLGLGEQMTSVSFANLTSTSSSTSLGGSGMSQLTSLSFPQLTGPMGMTMNLNGLATALTVNLGNVTSIAAPITLGAASQGSAVHLTLNAPACQSIDNSLYFDYAGKVTLNLPVGFDLWGSLHLSYSNRTVEELIELIDYLSQRIDGGYGDIYLSEGCADWWGNNGPWSHSGLSNALNTLASNFSGYIDYGYPPP